MIIAGGIEMSITLYFAKVNINSHIIEVYKNKRKFEEILKTIYLKIEDGINYYKNNLNITENGETYSYEANYKFNNITKFDDNTIYGSIIKKSSLFVNDLNEETGEVTKRPVQNSEVIEFYFDVYKEIIAYYTTNRFGFSEFSLAFKELLNKSMTSTNEEYYFEVSVLKEGLDVRDIRNELKKIGKLESLRIEFIPPNPDDELLDGIQDNGEEYIENIKEGNITYTSTIFKSKGNTGLNVDGKLIQEEFDKINNIHPKLNHEKAIRNGYLTVEGVNKSGRSFSTNENKQIRDTLEEKPKSIQDFAVKCKQKIATLANSLR